MTEHETTFTNAKALIRSLEATRVDDAPKTYDEYIALFSRVENTHFDLRPLLFRPEVSREAATLREDLLDSWHRVRTFYLGGASTARRRRMPPMIEDGCYALWTPYDGVEVHEVRDGKATWIGDEGELEGRPKTRAQRIVQSALNCYGWTALNPDAAKAVVALIYPGCRASMVVTRCNIRPLRTAK